MGDTKTMMPTSIMAATITRLSAAGWVDVGTDFKKRSV